MQICAYKPINGLDIKHARFTVIFVNDKSICLGCKFGKFLTALCVSNLIPRIKSAGIFVNINKVILIFICTAVSRYCFEIFGLFYTFVDVGVVDVL